MKRNKSRLIALSTTLLLAVFIIVAKDRILSFLPQKNNQLFPALKKESINELIIEKDAKINTIIHADKGWYVKKDGEESLADQERVEKIITNILGLKKEEVASTNKNKHKELGIDKQKIVVKTKTKQYNIYLGNMTSGTKNYIRINDENEVFIAAGFEEVFIPDDYRDMKANLVENEASVASVEIQFEGKMLKLERKGKDWFIGNKRAKKDRIDFFINEIKTLKGTDIAKDDILSQNISLKIIVKENGKEKTGAFYTKDQYANLLKTSVSNYVLQIPAPYLNSLKKEEKDFLE